MRKQLETEIKVGIFVTVGLALIMTAILLLGGSENLFSSKNRYTAHFETVEGLIPGARVILGGVAVGTVEDIQFDHKERNIVVQFSATKASKEWIRKDSSVEIATQGVLGDKFLVINAGHMSEPTLPSGSDLPTRVGKDFSQFLNKGDQLVVSLNNLVASLERILKNFEADNRSEIFFKGMSATAKNLSQVTEKVNHEMDQIQLKKAVNHLNEIFEKINNGTGTIGALVNDPSLYDEVRALFGGINRNRIMRNLVRQTVKDSETQQKAPKPDVKSP